MPLWGWGFLIGIAMILIIWFVFVAPMERQMHERKMELIRRRLKRNEERLGQLQEQRKYDDADADTDSSADSGGSADRP
ncbi:MAG: hypothetical protein ACE5FV_00705 [Woeseia sp.]